MGARPRLSLFGLGRHGRDPLIVEAENRSPLPWGELNAFVLFPKPDLRSGKAAKPHGAGLARAGQLAERRPNVRDVPGKRWRVLKPPLSLHISTSSSGLQMNPQGVTVRKPLRKGELLASVLDQAAREFFIKFWRLLLALTTWSARSELLWHNSRAAASVQGSSIPSQPTRRTAASRWVNAMSSSTG